MRASSFVQKILAVVLCMGVATRPAFGQAPAPTPIEDARAILLANNFEQTLDFMFAQLLPIMEAGFLGQIGQIDTSGELLRQIDAKYPGGQAAFANRFGELVLVNFRAAYPKMLEQAAEQYVAEIKAADLVSIRAFMESSAGRSVTIAQPKMQKSLSLSGQETGRKAGTDAAVQLMNEAAKYFESGK